MAFSAYFLVLSLYLAALASVDSCVYLYGSRHETNATGHYSYAYNGLDWPEEFSTCSGAHQSPIHVPGHTALHRLAEVEASRFNYGQLSSTGSNIKIDNNGHTVVVTLPSTYKPDASVLYKGDAATAVLTSKFSDAATGALTRANITPAQFHFHTRSEHLVDGKAYPLEMHIVNYVYNDTLPSCGPKGCITVVGILFELDESDAAEGNSFIDTVFKAMPYNEEETSQLGHTFLPTNDTLDFNKVFPADHSYITYEGSLTTPPCTWSSSVLWHLLTTPVKISKEQLHQFQLAVGETQCQDTNTTVVEAGTRSNMKVSELVGAATTRSETTDNSTTSGFEMPTYAADAEDQQMCRKIAGQNYREVQDLKERPIWFYPAQGICDPQLQLLSGNNKIIGNLLYPSKANTSMSLEQYHSLVDAGMTEDAKCAGVSSTAKGLKFTAGLFIQWVLGAAVVALLMRN